MNSYTQKLRDPRWQRRRLEIFQKSDFSCEHCSNTKKTLAVHHRRYIKGRDPWDYPDELLIALCEDKTGISVANVAELFYAEERTCS